MADNSDNTRLDGLQGSLFVTIGKPFPLHRLQQLTPKPRPAPTFQKGNIWAL